MIELIQAEANLETALAFAYRSDYGNANLRLRAVIRMLRDHGMFGNIGSHVLLLAAQRAHLLGQQALAHRYYSAGLQNLRPGSDLGIVFSVGLLGNKGAFDSSTPGPEDSAMIRDVIDCAKGGSSLRALGTFVGGLLEDGVGLKSVSPTPHTGSRGLTEQVQNSHRLGGYARQWRQDTICTTLRLSSLVGRLERSGTIDQSSQDRQ